MREQGRAGTEEVVKGLRAIVVLGEACCVAAAASPSSSRELVPQAPSHEPGLLAPLGAPPGNRLSEGVVAVDMEQLEYFE